jgi:two-component system, sensor histidine kinase
MPVVVMTMPHDGTTPPGAVSISKPVRIERLSQAINNARSGLVALPPVTSLSNRPRFTGRVLVVDDHPINRRLAEVLLGTLGVDVLQAVDGQEALDLLVHEPVTLVLMDCQMPVLDGLETTRRWRASEPTGSHLPIIALTANVFSDDRERCRAAGMDDFLGKPLNEEELINILHKYLPAAAVTPAENSSAAAPSSVTSVINPRTRAMLENMPGSAAGTTLFQELTAKFSADFNTHFDQLIADVIGENAVSAAQKAHALKGSCMTLGMSTLGSVLSDLEQLARANDLAGAVQLLSVIAEEWRQVTEALNIPASTST